MAYVVQVREMTRLGIPLLDAIERLGDHASSSDSSPGRRRRGDMSEKAIDAMNERSYAQLGSILKGTTFRGPRG